MPESLYPTDEGMSIDYLPAGHRVALGADLTYKFNPGDFSLRLGLGARGGFSAETPEGSERVDLRPTAEVGARIGIVRIGAGVHLLIPLATGASAPEGLGVAGEVNASVHF